MKQLVSIFALTLLSGPVAAEWQPDPDDGQHAEAQAALAAVREAGGEDFEELFDAAYAIAVFPRVVRNGLLLGWASGKGVLVENGSFTGYVRQRRFSLGFQFGRQSQGQVLLFRDRETVEVFKAGGLEFTPQASAHRKQPRSAADASFRPEVAVFSLSRDGLMVEAAVGVTGFKFIPPE
jgi:lipid-binding SYLF domain-containing protein